MRIRNYKFRIAGGYLLIFVSNNSIGKDVWFDNISLQHERGYVLEENHYYPFGLTISSAAAGGVPNKYKFGGKELEQSFGLELYDFHARQYDPQLGRFTSVDPLAEKFASMSPYSAMGNNPVFYINPDGRQIEPASQKEWDKQKQSVIDQRDILQGKIDGLHAKATEKGWSAEKLAGKIRNIQERVSVLNGAISNLGVLEASTQTYSLNSGATKNEVSYDASTGNIIISYRRTAFFTHETTHAGQFETGDIAFNSTNGAVLGQDVYDEVAGFKAQWAYDPSTVGGINSSNQITPSWVQGITEQGGNQPYKPGGTANTGISPVNINSSRDDIIKAYPHLKRKLQGLPANATFKSANPTMYYKKN